MSAATFDDQRRTPTTRVSARVRLASESCGRRDKISAQTRKKSLHGHSNGSRRALELPSPAATFAPPPNAIYQGAPLL